MIKSYCSRCFAESVFKPRNTVLASISYKRGNPTTPSMYFIVSRSVATLAGANIDNTCFQ